MLGKISILLKMCVRVLNLSAKLAPVPVATCKKVFQYVSCLSVMDVYCFCLGFSPFDTILTVS